MKQIVYVDVLIALNTIIGFFIIKSAVCICREKTTTVRVLTGCFMSGIYSLCIFLPPLDTWFTVLMRGLFIAAVSVVVFGGKSINRLIKCFGSLCGVTVLFAGLLLGVNLLVSPAGLMIRNGSVYFDVSFLSLVLGCAALYAVIWLFGRCIFRRDKESIMADVVLRFGKFTVKAKGIIDTGNLLADTFTGKPVNIISQNAALDLLPTEYVAAALEPSSETLPKGMHLIVSETVGGTALMCAFEVDEMHVTTQQGECIVKKAAVAVSTRADFGAGYTVLLNSELMNILMGGTENDKKNIAADKGAFSAKKKQRRSLHKRSGNLACTAECTAGKGGDKQNSAR